MSTQVERIPEETETRRCNLCGAAVGADQVPHWRKDGHDVFRCRSCHLLFRSTMPTAEELLAMYGDSYFRQGMEHDAQRFVDYLGDEPEHRLTARYRVKRLSRLGPVGRLLDVGCAAGFFMDEARKAGWQVEGIDVSPDMSAWGRDQLGLEIVSGMFQRTDYPPRSFDALTMWDYIEHSVDPALDFAKAAEVLRPGGALMLSTGDAAALVARISGRRWHLLTPRYHNFFFTAATLEGYLERNGFEVVNVGHPGAHYSLRYMVYKLRTMAPRSRGVRALGDWVAERAFGGRAVWFNLGDIVTIHARRR